MVLQFIKIQEVWDRIANESDLEESFSELGQTLDKTRNDTASTTHDEKKQFDNEFRAPQPQTGIRSIKVLLMSN